MIPEQLRPKKPFDLIDRIDEYVRFMRECGEADELTDALRHYIWSYLRDVPLDKERLKLLGVSVADLIYRYAGTTSQLDGLELPYLSSVVGYMLDRLRDRGVDIFYILDNDYSGREQRFQLTGLLFEAAGFAVVSPHNLWHGYSSAESPEERHKRVSEFTGDLSGQPLDNRVLSRAEVMAILCHHMAIPVGVVYVEKDASVDYLGDVELLATQSGYTVALRTQGIEDRNFRLLK